MRKFIINWKFIFVFAVLFILCLFYFGQLGEQLKPPMKGWSREIFLNEVNKSKVNDSTRVRVTGASLQNEKSFIVLWNEKDYIMYRLVSKDGVADKTRKISTSLDEPKTIKALVSNDNLLVYTLEGKSLKEYCIDYKANKLLYTKLIDDGVNSFVLIDKDIFMTEGSCIKYMNSEGHLTIACNTGASLIDGIKVSGNKYKIAFTSKDNIGTIYIKYLDFSPGEGPGKVYDVGMQISSVNEMSDLDNIVLGFVDNKVYVLTSRKIQAAPEVCKTPKVTSNRVMIYTFDDGRKVKLKEAYANDLTALDPNPVRIQNSQREMEFICSVVSIKGTKTQMYNLRDYYLRDGVVIPGGFLTRTADISVNPNYFQIEGDKYLVWEDRTGVSTKIMFASTNKKIIDSTEKINKKDLQAVFQDSIMDVGFSMSYILLFFTIIVLPTILCSFIASMFFMNWLEEHPRLSAFIAVCIQIAAEIALTHYMIVRNTGILALEPGYLQNPILRYLIILLLGGVSYYCLNLKYKDVKLDKTFINQYAFFSVLNMVLYALLFYPYYYL